MADPNKKNEQQKAQEQKTQQLNIDVRTNLHNAYAFVEGQKSAQSFSAFTIEEAHDRFIERVEGDSTPYRPNVLERIDRIAQNISSVISKVKAMPPEAFRKTDSKTDVNTTVEEET